jgi:uncharacterized protein YoxC
VSTPNSKSPTPTPELSPEQAALLSLEVALTDFTNKFHASARRWERMVYPAIFIFGILGLSGFWLIYSLTWDMHDMSLRIDPLMADNLATMSRSVAAMTGSVASMDHQIQRITAKIEDMDKHIGDITDTIATMETHTGQVSEKLNTLQPLLANIAEMNHSMKAMTANTTVMSRDVNSMGRPMSIMQGFSPW